MEVVVIEEMAVSSPALGFIHGGVGRLEQGLERFSVLGLQRHPGKVENYLQAFIQQVLEGEIGQGHGQQPVHHLLTTQLALCPLFLLLQGAFLALQAPGQRRD